MPDAHVIPLGARGSRERTVDAPSAEPGTDQRPAGGGGGPGGRPGATTTDRRTASQPGADAPTPRVGRARCRATGPDGVRCRAVAIREGLCQEHAAAVTTRPHRADDAAAAARAAAAEIEISRSVAAATGSTEPSDWERKVAGALAFLRRRITGEYAVDDFGFDPDLTDHVLMPPLRPLYERYFRIETRGLDHVPDSGGALVVANHSGTLPLDALMTQLALLDHHPAHRHLRMLGADLVFRLPVVAPLARKGGNTLACNADAERLLSAGELAGVWPEGFKGIGKPFRERYKLQRFGRGGFVSAALRTGVPIVPCSIIGAEEIYPMIGNLKTLARLLGLPYLPITPTWPWLGLLGSVPLPSKWIIEFGEPIDTTPLGGGAADDPMLVFNLTDQVRETIQQTLYKLLMQRRSVFF